MSGHHRTMGHGLERSEVVLRPRACERELIVAYLRRLAARNQLTAARAALQLASQLIESGDHLG